MIQELVESCGGLSRMELARTVCELLDWKRPTGKLKARECREFLERLEGEGRLELPDNARVSRSGHEPEYRKPSVASRLSRWRGS